MTLKKKEIIADFDQFDYTTAPEIFENEIVHPTDSDEDYQNQDKRNLVDKYDYRRNLDKMIRLKYFNKKEIDIVETKDIGSSTVLTASDSSVYLIERNGDVYNEELKLIGNIGLLDDLALRQLIAAGHSISNAAEILERSNETGIDIWTIAKEYKAG